MTIEVGQIIEGKYRVVSVLGEGGMGAVFAGEHLKLHRKVAIKVMHPSLAGNAEVVERFEREAQAAGRIGNDHILDVLDIGQLHAGDRYMVMEFLDGEALNERLTRMGRATPHQIYPLARQTLEGLAAAHAAGIVHRDLKPANIFILREKAGIADYVKIIDFGVSKFRNLGGDSSQTRTGAIVGTPSYMSPEQARGLRDVDWRSDIYAVGVILYEAVSGRVPFDGNSVNDLLFNIFLNEVPPIESFAKDIDPAFAAIVMRALAKEPGERFASAAAFIAALDGWAQQQRGMEGPAFDPSPLAASATDGPRPLRPSERTRLPAPPTQKSWAESQPSVPGAPSPHGASRASGVALLGAAVVLVGIGVGLTTMRHPQTAPATTQATLALPAPLPSQASPPPPVLAKPVTPIPEVSSLSRKEGDAGGAALPASTTKKRHSPPAPAPAVAPRAHATVDPLEQL